MDKTRSALVGVVVCLVLLAALAGACPWSCPNGLVARQNLLYNATANGCGPAGLHVSTKWEFTPCCDHDLCYQVCGGSKKACDDAFLKCLNDVCKQVKKKKQQAECQQTAALFSLATTTFGCSSYQQSQTAACVCDSRDEL
ncbi:uncharacterized protein ACA1_227800 [Acanthamoeba castellanii str. Neff]|uniref:Phospholipase A2 n=1 Tax=Acanthamoeba castellanii (strain ATCC 30010 / Neff) TaxID=1257118 RepID=L8H7W8_ACACF|nr:uncharacterized protein ACA1_227800 [Acanthamoeba castellanii str. Neff]ELR21579.1 hypothetical protein ACA1_227800 [Acanthamoeba castellanii str. Neff]